MDRGSIVTYKDFSRKLAGHCGIVESVLKDKPDHVLVRWLGSNDQSEESIANLDEV